MTVGIIIITSLVSFLAFSNRTLFRRLSFNAWLIKEKKQSWRFLSYALVHAGWLHLLINMFVLYNFGRYVEQSFGFLFGSSKALLYYGLLYIGGVLFATLFDFGKHKDNPYYEAVGASGAVAAVLFASILLAPSMSLFIFPIPFPIPAWLFGILYLAYSVYMGKKGQDNIGHHAHFFGAVYGLVFTIILHPPLLGHFIKTITGGLI